MTDYFALLGQERRPRIDPDDLKEKYQQLARTAHPDQAASQVESTEDLAALNEGYRVLLDPKLRLRHLLDLEGIPLQTAAIPQELSDVFIEAGTLIQQIDSLLARSTITSALAKALINSELADKQRSTADLLVKLHALRETALEELDALDRNWTAPKNHAAALSDLASRFAYLSRWAEQLEERKFRLSNPTG